MPTLRQAQVTQAASQVSIDSFICPSVGGARGSTENDNEGFGYTDYAPIILVDDIVSLGGPSTPKFSRSVSSTLAAVVESVRLLTEPATPSVSLRPLVVINPTRFLGDEFHYDLLV